VVLQEQELNLDEILHPHVYIIIHTNEQISLLEVLRTPQRAYLNCITQ
jgi:hypothetical protein